MAIMAHAAASKSLQRLHGASVAVCVGAREPRLRRYTMFPTQFDLLSFPDLVPLLPQKAEVLVHLPEVWVERLGVDCTDLYRSRQDISWRFNVLLQNIDRLPSRDAMRALAGLGVVTATAAHRSYATDGTSAHLGCHTRYLGAWPMPDPLPQADFSTKQPLIAISPDWHPQKEAIKKVFARALPDHTIVEIRKLPYLEYLHLLRRSRFAMTFGEGFDGYFIEPILSGTIGMALYNERFFTADFHGLPGVFSSTNPADEIYWFLKTVLNENAYRTILSKQRLAITAAIGTKSSYVARLTSYYSEFFAAPSAALDQRNSASSTVQVW